MKAKFFCLVAIFLSSAITAQTPQDALFTDYSQPSPDVASLSKYQDYPVSISNGTIGIDIPLYTIQELGTSIPISLSYNTSGIKVTEVASWVGLGWSLQAGGVIGREMRGRPDEDANGFLLLRALAGKTTYDHSNITDRDFLIASTTGLHDSQPDVFNFSFPGYSGKFVFDNSNGILITPHQPLEIDYGTGFSWFEITTPEGYKYRFSKSETTFYHHGTDYPSSWHLTKITPPNGSGEITFSYRNELVEYDWTTSWSASVDINSTLGSYPLSNFQVSAPNVQKLKITTAKLSKIETPTLTVNFIESSLVRDDLLNSKSLSRIEILEKNKTTVLKEFIFTTSYFESIVGTTDPNELRLKLDWLQERGPDGTSFTNQTYSFDYQSNVLPSRTSKAVDHWGYFNGATNNIHLIPDPFEYNSLLSGAITGANRKGNANSLACMLKKITYPTGGFVEFEFEPHEVKIRKEEMLVDFFEHKIKSLSATGNSIQYPSGASNTTVIMDILLPNGPAPTYSWPAESQSFKFFTTGSIYLIPQLTVSHSDNGQGTSNRPSGYVYIAKKSSPDIPVFVHTYQSAGTFNYDNLSFSLEDNTEYFIFTKTFEHNDYSISASLNWNNDKGFENMTVGGCRIKSKKYYTSNSGQATMVKTYGYNMTTLPSRSSGKIYDVPTYMYDYGVADAMCLSRKPTIVMTSNNMNEIYSAGSHVGYDNITEYIGLNGENGKTEFQYWNPAFAIAHGPESGPVTSTGWKSGKLEKIKKFSKDDISNSFKLVSETLYDFDYEFHEVGTSKGLAIAASTSLFFCRQPSHQVGYLDYRTYEHESYFIALKSTTEKLYDENELLIIESTQNYDYNIADNHFQQTEIETQRSTGVSEKNITLYVNDFPANTTGIIATLKTKNLNLPIASLQLVDGLYLSGKFIEYKLDAFGNIVTDNIYIIETQSGISTDVKAAILTGGGPTSDFKLTAVYDLHDDEGNPLEFHYVNGESKSLLWDDNSKRPLAIATNASYADVAYTSFEENAYGKLTFAASNVVSSATFVPTGSNYYNLETAHPVSLTGLSSSNSYIVSFWAKDGSPSVNNSAPSLIRTNDLGWNYYEITVNSINQITVAGNAKIDELRTYPSNSQIMSYTHTPLFGISTATDTRGETQYFEYNGLGQLKVVKDSDGNILQKNHYQQIQALP